MDFKVFSEKVLEEIQRLNPDKKVILQKRVKNNGVELTGISYSRNLEKSPMEIMEDALRVEPQTPAGKSMREVLLQNEVDMSLPVDKLLMIYEELSIIDFPKNAKELEDIEFNPLVYLDAHYKPELSESEFSNIIKVVNSQLNDLTYGNPDEIVSTMKSICDYEKIRNRIYLCLVNTMRNREKLDQGLVFKSMGDMSVIYKVIVGVQEGGVTATIVVNKAIFKEWGITEEELFDRALFNTMIRYPAYAESFNTGLKIENELNHVADDDEQDVFTENLYRVTSQESDCGAAVVLYPDFLMKLCKEIKAKGLYLIMNDTGRAYVFDDQKNAYGIENDGEKFKYRLNKYKLMLNLMIPDDEVLSECIYRYDLKENEIKLVSNPDIALRKLGIIKDKE